VAGRDLRAQVVDATAGLRVEHDRRHVDPAVQPGDPLRGFLPGQIRFGEQQQRFDLVLQRKGDELVDHHQVQRRVDQRRHGRDGVDVGRHRLGSSPARAAHQREAARVDGVDHDPVFGDHLRVDEIARHHHLPAPRVVFCRPAQRRQARLGLVLGHDPGGVAADRDHPRAAESLVAHANV